MNILYLLLLNLFFVEAYASIDPNYNEQELPKQESEECGICAKQKLPEAFHQFRCTHNFCKKCIRKWAAQNLEDWDDIHLFRCPLCRYIITEEDLSNMPFCEKEYQTLVNLKENQNRRHAEIQNSVSINADQDLNIELSGNNRLGVSEDSANINAGNNPSIELSGNNGSEIFEGPICISADSAINTESPLDNKFDFSDIQSSEASESTQYNIEDYLDKRQAMSFISFLSLYKANFLSKKYPVYKKLYSWVEKRFDLMTNKTKKILVETKNFLDQKIKKHPKTIIASGISISALGLYLYKYGFKNIPGIGRKIFEQYEECPICYDLFTVADSYKLGCACPRNIHNACLNNIIQPSLSYNYLYKAPKCPWCRYEITREEIDQFHKVLYPEININISENYIVNSVLNVKNWFKSHLF